MTNSIVAGSLTAISQTSGKSLAESFVSCNHIIIIDTSGSMGTRDSRDGMSRYDVACAELINLQRNLPGKVAIIAFSETVQFCPSGIPVYFGGGTAMEKALAFARVADIDGMHFVLISDGEPNIPQQTLAEARQYHNHIDVIYVGPEDHPAGREFLYQLAGLTGGQRMTIDRARGELETGIMKLLASG